MRKIKRYMKKIIITVKREYIETKKMLKTFKNKDVDNYPQAKGQFVDILKFLLILPISILPGSVVVLTVLEVVAKGFNTTVFPKKQKFKES